MNILVVDDSPTIRAALKGLLERMGHTVVEADDGKKALQKYRQEAAGPRAHRRRDADHGRIRGRAAHARDQRRGVGADHFPELEGSDQDLNRAIEAGGDDYLVKPVSFVVLNAKIRALQRLESMRAKQLEMSRDLASANPSWKSSHGRTG